MSDRIIVAVIVTLGGVALLLFAKAFSEYKPPWMQRAFGPDVGPIKRIVGRVVYTSVGIAITGFGVAFLVYTVANR